VLRWEDISKHRGDRKHGQGCTRYVALPHRIAEAYLLCLSLLWALYDTPNTWRFIPSLRTGTRLAGNIWSHEWNYTHGSGVRYIAISPLYPHRFPSAVQNKRWRKGRETKGRLGGTCPAIHAHVLILITLLPGLRGTEKQSGDLQISL